MMHLRISFEEKADHVSARLEADRTEFGSDLEPLHLIDALGHFLTKIRSIERASPKPVVLEGPSKELWDLAEEGLRMNKRRNDL